MTGAALDDPHLLVVDDDERLRALLTRYLSGNGFRVSAAPGAAEARALMKSMAFDLLILDVMMPGESGLDLARSVRAGSQVPILMLTARGEPADRIAGLELGVDDYLPKPFEPRELLLRVSALLRRAAPVAKAAALPVKMGSALYDPKGARLTKNGKPVKLTSAEAALPVSRPAEIRTRRRSASASGARCSSNASATSCSISLRPDPAQPPSAVSPSSII